MTQPPAANKQAHISPVAFRELSSRFAALAEQPGAVWLDSGETTSADANYDIVSASPRWHLRARPVSGGQWQLEASELAPAGDLFEAIDSGPPASLPDATPELPFVGGTIGYLGYDISQSLETLPPPREAVTPFPLAYVGYYPWALVQHRASRQAWLVSLDEQGASDAREHLRLMDSHADAAARFELTGDWQANMNRVEYEQAIGTIQRYISAGDCYQVNFAQRFSAPYRGSPFSAYCQLRQALPSPFSAFINSGSGCLLSHSPERFLSVVGDRISTSPIKGTRPRGQDKHEDQQLAWSLLNSVKDRAENLMIVDLLRNDLGRSCLPGSIEAQQLFNLQSYANVHHLVSTITGQLRPDTTATDAFRQAFPGGSITGAPKIRAMEIIHELEPDARSAYCGSVFYRSAHGHFDSSITIRTVLADGEQLHCWGGGGIVADSNPTDEYAESIAKVRLLMDSLAPGK